MSPAVRESVDVLVVGAGVIGLAVGRAMAQAGLQVAVIERKALPGQGASSRNSGVIHAGLYYPPDSLKAELCLQGNRLLYNYCQQHNIAHQRCGKLVVAQDQAEEAALCKLKNNALINGVGELTWLDRTTLQKRYPQIEARAALFSGSTGIIDAHQLIQQLHTDLEAAGGVLAPGNTFVHARPLSRGLEVTLRHSGGSDTLQCRYLINSAGLQAAQVARAIDTLSSHHIPEIRLARGNYFRLRGAAPADCLVYPLPAEHGLGIHLTLGLDGAARLGPDVEWIDEEDYQVNASRRAQFVEAARRYLPGLEESRLEPDYAGIRCKGFFDGTPCRDFVIQTPAEHGIAGLVNLFAIESPGLTSSLALANRVCDLLLP